MPRNMYITSSSSSSSSFFVIVAVVVLVVGVRALRAAFVVVTLFPVFHSSPCTAKLYLHFSPSAACPPLTRFLFLVPPTPKAFASLFYLAGNFQSVINSPCRHMSPCVCFIERDHQLSIYTRTLLELIMKCNFPFSVQRITDSGYMWATRRDVRKQQQQQQKK